MERAKPGFRIGEEFRPAPQFRKLYFIYLAIPVIFFLVIILAPLFAFAFTEVFLIVFLALVVPILAIALFTCWWIPKYYTTILYRLTSTEIVWRRGVWFKKTGLVPYNRITNVDVSQGPVSRSLGIGTLKIQTAGYSSPSGRSSEITLDGIEDFEGLREMIMGFVRGVKPVAVETYEKAEPSSRILNEVIRIRKLLEQSKK